VFPGSDGAAASSAADSRLTLPRVPSTLRGISFWLFLDPSAADSSATTRFLLDGRRFTGDQTYFASRFVRRSSSSTGKGWLWSTFLEFNSAVLLVHVLS